MIEPLNLNASRIEAEDPTADSSGRLAPTYLIGFAFLIGLYFFSGLLEASKRGFSLSATYVAAEATVAVLLPVIFAIPAGIITAIGAIWIKKDRGILFARSVFFLMAIMIPLLVFTRLFLAYGVD